MRLIEERYKNLSKDWIKCLKKNRRLRVFKEDVSRVKFEELWYSRPGDTVIVDDIVVIVLDHKYKGDQISFVDVKIKGE